MYTLLLILLTISCLNSDKFDKQEAILNFIESDQFIGYETSETIYVIQFDSSTNEIYDFRQANAISISGNFLTLYDDNKNLQITTDKETSADLTVIGIITITKGEDFQNSIVDVINNIVLTESGNCWSGGPGSLSCSTSQRSSSIKVSCSPGYFACCHRGMTGLCVSRL
jgi:hypothetical protein